MGRRHTSARALKRLFWLNGEPDPRLLQLEFVLLIALAGLAAVPFGGWSAVSVAEQVALVLALLTLVATIVATHHVADPLRTTFVLSIIDLGIVGVSAQRLDVGTLPFVVIPSLWLGRQLRWRAIPVAGLATLVLVTIPALLAHGNEDGTVAQVVPLPLVAMLAALAIAVGLDVAASAQAEAERALAELARQRRSSQAIFEAVDIGLALVDTDGDPTLMNRSMRRNAEMAYPNGVREARRVIAADGETVLAIDHTPSKRAGRGEEFDDLRVWVGDDVATRRALSVSARRVEDDDGTVVAAALAYKDVTDYMRALEVKDQFIALISHELRTPLTPIYGYVTMLQENDDLPELARKQLAVVARSTDRLRGLVDDLLEAAQVASGGLSLAPGPVDLAAIVAESLSSAQVQAEDAGIVLESAVPPAVPLVGDPVRLAQVVDNLLSNAVKYTPRGGTVRVDLVRHDRSVELRVRDTGLGIPADDVAHVFTRFFRTKEATNLAIGGIGLGLSITKEIVEGHGGAIAVHSEVGCGSEFRVSLPSSGVA
ncbi:MULTISPECIES: sensor histidine kinase [unclassified Nocardioides]|uniref:sensor histidine kinase n=1 Tax=unclassified Nocardioides TaxID=2615069 RepID=UPI00361E803F